jgi:hypothetical protein
MTRDELMRHPATASGGDIDEFIVANSSLHPARPTLQRFKHKAEEDHIRNARRPRGPQFCKNDDMNSFAAPALKKFRQASKRF